MLRQTRLKIFFILSVLFFSTTILFATEHDFNQHWSTTEHLEAGNKLDLLFCNKGLVTCTVSNAQSRQAGDILLTLDNGLRFTFGEIITLAGDYFAEPDLPITGGLYDNFNISEQDYQNPVKILSDSQFDKLKPRFEKAFLTLSADWRAERISELVFKYINGELSLEDAISLGLQRYDLAVNNFDHFAPYSWYAYSTGHAIALDFAAKAGMNNNQADLKYAYAIEAFAQHYLTDSFSAGHMRVPLKQIRRFVFFEKNGLLLTKFMHDEDSKFGVNLYNLSGDSWRSYGDDYYRDSRNKFNREMLASIQQLSITQVFQAYSNKKQVNINENLDEISKLMPIVSTKDYNDGVTQNSPLFSADSSDNIYIRSDINSLKDKYTKQLSQFGAMTFLIEKLFTYNPS